MKAPLTPPPPHTNLRKRTTEREGGGMADGRTMDGRTMDGRTMDGRTTEGRTTDGRTTDGRPIDIQFFLNLFLSKNI